MLTEGLSRHHYAKGVGAGVGMLTQYTTYADPASTTACSRPRSDGGAAAPGAGRVVRRAEYVAAPVQRAAWRPQP